MKSPEIAAYGGWLQSKDSDEIVGTARSSESDPVVRWLLESEGYAEAHINRFALLGKTQSKLTRFDVNIRLVDSPWLYWWVRYASFAFQPDTGECAMTAALARRVLESVREAIR